MRTTDARAWAYLIVDRLGLPYTKASIIRFAKEASESEVWEKFIACNPVYKEAAKANHIEGPADIYSFVEEASYAAMRSTYPSKSHGRGVIGPRILSLQQLKEQKRVNANKRESYTERLSEITQINVPHELIGKIVYHEADNGITFGTGIITGVDEDKDTITVEFSHSGIKTLRYLYCVERGYIKFI